MSPYLPISPLYLPISPLYLADFAWTGAPPDTRSTLPARPFPARPLPLSSAPTPRLRRAGAPAHVLDQGDVRCAEAELREVHVAPYLPAPCPLTLTLTLTPTLAR